MRDEDVSTASFEFGGASVPQFNLPEEEPVTEKRKNITKNKSRFASIHDLEKEEQQDEEEEGQR